MKQLKEKYFDLQFVKFGFILFGLIEDEMFEVVYLQINGEMIREVVLRIKGVGGLCGVDVNGFWRIFVCKFFKQFLLKLCDVLV